MAVKFESWKQIGDNTEIYLIRYDLHKTLLWSGIAKCDCHITIDI